MNGRSSSFLLIAATMLLVLMIVQMIFKPPAEPDPAAGEIDPVAQMAADENTESRGLKPTTDDDGDEDGAGTGCRASRHARA